MEIFLHVGLHKTGTTYLQDHIFPNLSKSEILYNPVDIMKQIRILTHLPRDERGEVIKKLQDIITNYSEKYQKLFISDENLTQNFCVQNFEEFASLWKACFGNAKIILFLRYQTSWILSCYKQSVDVGDCQSIEKLLGYENGEVTRSEDVYNKDNLVQLNIYKADWSILVSSFQKHFEKENVAIFFHEDFVKDNEKIINQVFDLIGIKNRPKVVVAKSIPGHSAFSLTILLIRQKLITLFGLKFLIVSIKDRRDQLELDIKEGKEDLFFKSPFDPIISLSEARRSYGLVKLVLLIIRKLFRLRFYTFQNFLRNFVDRIYFFDWDLMKRNGIREQLDRHFHELNNKLINLVDKDRIPPKYLGPQNIKGPENGQ